MGILIAILIFTAVVVFHELGHFALAKKSGVIVNEFCAGMGPKLISYVKGNLIFLKQKNMKEEQYIL